MFRISQSEYEKNDRYKNKKKCRKKQLLKLKINSQFFLFCINCRQGFHQTFHGFFNASRLKNGDYDQLDFPKSNHNDQKFNRLHYDIQSKAETFFTRIQMTTSFDRKLLCFYFKGVKNTIKAINPRQLCCDVRAHFGQVIKRKHFKMPHYMSS